MRDKVDENGIMSKWHRDGTWQSEFARGMGLFVKDNNLWDEQVDYTSDKKAITYYEWMRKNADAARETRERVNNITFNEWAKPTPLTPEPGKTWTALEMVGAVIMTQTTLTGCWALATTSSTSGVDESSFFVSSLLLHAVESMVKRKPSSRRERNNVEMAP